MGKWVVGEKCFSLRYGEGVVSEYEEGLKYPVTTMHINKWKGRKNIYEEAWTEEGRQYEFDECPTLFSSIEEVGEWIKLVLMEKVVKRDVASRGGDIQIMKSDAIDGEIKGGENDTTDSRKTTMQQDVLCSTCKD